MKSCEYYEELISRSLDDALSVEERKELAVHLANCPSCSQMRQLMADISGMMEEDTEELPAGLHENIMASIRRSEMIKANKTAGTPGKHFVPRKFTITRPVRNILATAACMAVVIAAALSVNPAGRAENVIASRSMPEATETQMPQAAAAAPATVTPAAAPTMKAAPTAEPVDKAASPDIIVTTPAPTKDVYLSTPTPQPTQAPAQSIVGNPVSKATPTPVPTPEPVVTEAPAATDAPAPTEAPSPTEVPATAPEGDMEEIDSSVQENDTSADAAVPQEEVPAEIQKAPPMRLFSMIPSLAELIPEKAADENAEAALSTAPPTATSVPTPAPTDAPQPVELDLMDSETAGNLVLLLAGTLDEKGQPPEETELPEGLWDESYVVEMVFDQIPCELTVRLYGQEVYFSLAEILIDPAAVDDTGGTPALPMPSPVVTPDQDVDGGEPVTGKGEAPCEAPAEDFEPQWLLAKCGSDAFTALLDEIVK